MHPQTVVLKSPPRPSSPYLKTLEKAAIAGPSVQRQPELSALYFLPTRHTTSREFILGNLSQGFPWWLSGKEFTGQYRGHGFNPRSVKILHAVEQLSPCTTTIVPVLQSIRATTTQPTCHDYWSPGTLEPMLHNKRRLHNEKPVHHN